MRAIAAGGVFRLVALDGWVREVDATGGGGWIVGVV